MGVNERVRGIMRDNITHADLSGPSHKSLKQTCHGFQYHKVVPMNIFNYIKLLILGVRINYFKCN